MKGVHDDLEEVNLTFDCHRLQLSKRKADCERIQRDYNYLNTVYKTEVKRDVEGIWDAIGILQMRIDRKDEEIKELLEKVQDLEGKICHCNNWEDSPILRVVGEIASDRSGSGESLEYHDAPVVPSAPEESRLVEIEMSELSHGAMESGQLEDWSELSEDEEDPIENKEPIPVAVRESSSPPPSYPVHALEAACRRSHFHPYQGSCTGGSCQSWSGGDRDVRPASGHGDVESDRSYGESHHPGIGWCGDTGYNQSIKGLSFEHG